MDIDQLFSLAKLECKDFDSVYKNVINCNHVTIDNIDDINVVYITIKALIDSINNNKKLVIVNLNHNDNYKLINQICYNNGISFLFYKPNSNSFEVTDLLIINNNDYINKYKVNKCVINLKNDNLVPTDLINRSVAIFLHIGNFDLVEYFLNYINIVITNINIVDLYITYQTDNVKLDLIKTLYPNTIFIKSLRGCDIGAQLLMIDSAIKNSKNYDYVLKLHTKSKTAWRNQLIQAICGNREQLDKVFTLFDNKKCGMVCHSAWRGRIIDIDTDNNFLSLLNQTCLRLGLNFNPDKQLFVMGTIFWFRWSVMVDFVNKNKIDLINEQQLMQLGYVDGTNPTLMHCWERVFGIIYANVNNSIKTLVSNHDLTTNLNKQFDIVKTTKSDINEHLDTLYNYAKNCNHITYCGLPYYSVALAFVKGLKDSTAGDKKIVFIHNKIDKDIDQDFDKILTLATNNGIKVKFWHSDNAKIDIKRTDLLFIDTWHVYAQLKRELTKHRNKVNKYIIMHDTTVDAIKGESIRCAMDINYQAYKTGYGKDEIARGLWPAIEEFLENDKDYIIDKHFTNCNGLTILGKSVKDFTIVTIIFDINNTILNYNNNLCIYCNSSILVPIWIKRKQLGLLDKTYINLIDDGQLIYKMLKTVIDTNSFKTSHFMWILSNVDDDMIKTILANFTTIFTNEIIAADKDSFSKFLVNKLENKK